MRVICIDDKECSAAIVFAQEYEVVSSSLCGCNSYLIPSLTQKPAQTIDCRTCGKRWFGHFGSTALKSRFIPLSDIDESEAALSESRKNLQKK